MNKTASKWLAKGSAWKSQALIARCHSCRIMLVIHGLLSEAESEKVKKRIGKIIAKELKP